MQTITQASVSALKKDAEAAHEAYSIAWEKLCDDEASLAEAAKSRSALVAALDARRRLLSSLRTAAIEAAIRGAAGFEMAVQSVTSGAAEVTLLEQAIQKFHAFEYQDAQRAMLEAKVVMLEKQHFAESLRLKQRVAEIELGLLNVASRNGGSLQVQMSGAIRGSEELVARIARECEAGRADLAGANEQTRGLRESYEENI
jgi:hypothetical protein